MSELGSGSGSTFPNTLDTNSILEYDASSSNKTRARADVVNDLADAIVNIETNIGTGAKGTYSDIAARLSGTVNTKYCVRKMQVTGTTGSPQTVSYADLTAISGDTIPTTLTSPLVLIVGQYQSRGAYKTETEGTTSFKIAKEDVGVGSTVYVDLLILEGSS